MESESEPAEAEKADVLACMQAIVSRERAAEAVEKQPSGKRRILRPASGMISNGTTQSVEALKASLFSHSSSSTST